MSFLEQIVDRLSFEQILFPNAPTTTFRQCLASLAHNVNLPRLRYPIALVV